MSSESPTFFQTATRLVIMVGTLACGSLAAWHYGPEPDQLADLIDQTAAMVIDVPQSIDQTKPVEGLGEAIAFAQIEASSDEAPAVSDELPRWDSAVEPATAMTPIESPARAPSHLMDPLERERLTAPVLAAGATRADIQPWGPGQTPAYRATAAAAVGRGTVGLERRYDAFGETPEAAVASLMQQLRQPMRR